MEIELWAMQWGVPREAVSDLRRRFIAATPQLVAEAKYDPTTEAGAQMAVRAEASALGALLMRNNVGVLRDERGVPVRYGLANDSKAMNSHIKSSDLIGIRPVAITPAHVGLTVGQFVAREMKAPGWVYRGTDREKAQLRFLKMIAGYGGDACFCTGRGTL